MPESDGFLGAFPQGCLSLLSATPHGHSEMLVSGSRVSGGPGTNASSCLLCRTSPDPRALS